MDYTVKDVACMLTYYFLDNPFFKKITNDVRYINILDEGIEEFVKRAETLLVASGCVAIINLAEILNPYAKYLSD